MVKKYYCYVDETGQDTKGDFFLVSLLISEKEDLTGLRKTLSLIEADTKGKTKWTKTNNKNKVEYIRKVLSVNILKNKAFYSVYNNTTAYTPLTAMTISKAVINRTVNGGDYRVNIVIDGLRKSDRQIIRIELKNLGIKYDKIKINLKDEQEILLRLADALAGFVRDYSEGKKYAGEILGKNEFNKIFRKI